jgi:membrane-associated HD superfamily phosphohydrolase
MPPGRQWLLFGAISSLDDARRIARRAAIAGYLLLITGIINIALWLAGYVGLPRTIVDLAGSSMVAVVILQIVGLLVLWCFAARVATARGYICAALLALWLALHAWDSALNSDAHMIFSIGYAVMTLLMVDGVRACWIGARLFREPVQI